MRSADREEGIDSQVSCQLLQIVAGNQGAHAESRHREPLALCELLFQKVMQFSGQLRQAILPVARFQRGSQAFMSLLGEIPG